MGGLDWSTNTTSLPLLLLLSATTISITTTGIIRDENISRYADISAVAATIYIFLFIAPYRPLRDTYRHVAAALKTTPHGPIQPISLFTSSTCCETSQVLFFHDFTTSPQDPQQTSKVKTRK